MRRVIGVEHHTSPILFLRQCGAESEGVGARSVRTPLFRKHLLRTRDIIYVRPLFYPLNHIRSCVVEWVEQWTYIDIIQR